ncbi:hypothetical protein L1765_00355 [Microaerobacter geothermalis]|uniref:hypothetical protein n=1 Tax=Microaerobacter geothermalis TaxID=674972 RepID=UPI001F3FF75E|nr:hypothetical protein [Microaerobacter geothermalis]MCF6092442.1 hypothetical protein [Microaerobacter geothermalis]
MLTDYKHIQKLRIKRHHILQNYLHQASRIIIELAKTYQVGKIVIGEIKEIKQHNPIKTFVQIPIQRFVQMNITTKTDE